MMAIPNKKDMLSDIEIILNWLDSTAESLRNGAHFDAKFFVDRMRKKYGIKTKTKVSVALIMDPTGRMTVDKYKRVFR